MKLRHLMIAALAVLLSTAAFAIPAKPGAFTYTQPDGSVVRLELHGDEFFHWTTLAGTNQVVKLDANGYWQKSTLDPVVMNTALARRRAVNASRQNQLRTHTDNVMTHGERHIPVILVNFSDRAFSIDSPNARFTAMLNEKGYSANGGTGSVQDFYVDNSNGAFTPIFDVYGPVTLSNNMAYYGGNTSSGGDKNPELALLHGCQLLDDQIDFSNYDYDNNGYVDMILFYYAGYNEAEGGPANTIWPHSYSMQYSSQGRSALFDGLYLDTYFCTSELKGTSGTRMCGIGTTSHEFGHSLGLPDFYDTDYNKNGQAGGLYYFSTMDSGSYNNDGCTPPYFNAEERIYLGWMTPDDIQELPAGKFSFGSVKGDIAYKTLTDVEGEYFLYECRDGSDWDAPLPTGLLIYHVDKSTVRKVGGHTPYDHWTHWGNWNAINAYGSHPCFYLIPSGNPTSLNYTGGMKSVVFPGSKNVTGYTPVDWNQNDTGTSISGISYAGGNVTLTTTYSVERTIIGTVTGQDGSPIEGVTVSLSEGEPASIVALRIAPRNVTSTMTDADGSFTFSLAGFEGSSAHLFFSKEGYQSLSKDVTLASRATIVNVVMKKVGEGEMKEYSYFDPDGVKYIHGITQPDQMAAIRIPAGELPANGGTLTSISLPIFFNGEYSLIAEAGDERILTCPIEPKNLGQITLDPYDLGDYAAEFPGGVDLYVGFAVKGVEDYNGQYVPNCITPGSGNYYIAAYDTVKGTWEQISGYDLIISATVIGKGDDVPPVEITSFAEMGFNTIADPGSGEYSAGTAFPLELALVDGVTAESATWTFDGENVTGAKSVTLTAGSHVLIAKVALSDGTKETFQMNFLIQ